MIFRRRSITTASTWAIVLLWPCSFALTKPIASPSEMRRAKKRRAEKRKRRNDPGHRQLRFIHLQPRPASGRAGRRPPDCARDRGRPQRPDYDRADRKTRAQTHRAFARPDRKSVV